MVSRPPSWYLTTTPSRVSRSFSPAPPPPTPASRGLPPMAHTSGSPSGTRHLACSGLVFRLTSARVDLFGPQPTATAQGTPSLSAVPSALIG
ncbi:hypothetical protein L873DRAFT_1823331 [Choiromyces venosus 120613-1]|uniref:Uncharacterized protein n=1 Tax=Choiromyces venosus 120613-1 TaxID=1336337 RepID=A0A3N4IWK7_9PEZI|nr:hypothetical protein L873DRAFT_1823331 [Choiromyces venosus 120613-1]